MGSGSRSKGLVVAQTVLVRAGGRLWALPGPMVEQVQQVKADALRDVRKQYQRSRELFKQAPDTMPV